jgi:hypothetical protein
VVGVHGPTARKCEVKVISANPLSSLAPHRDDAPRAND